MEHFKFFIDFKFFINENFTNDQLILFACYGFLTGCYHSLKILSNIKPADMFPREHRFIDSDSEASESSETSEESEPSETSEVIINDHSEASEEEPDDPCDQTYTQPSNYTSKLRKRRKLI
jgi:hypothetical protein